MSRTGGGNALVIDPGDEPERIEQVLDEAGLRAHAILVTHGHFDHIGGVARLASARQCPVYISSPEAVLLERINDFLWPGFGPYEPYVPDVLLDGGEELELAGLRIRTLLAPGHSPASLVYLLEDPDDGQNVLAVGDVIFAGSVGRTDLPGGSWPQLERSLVRLYEWAPLDAPVLNGHGPVTTLRRELLTNPFLDAVRAARVA